MPAPLGGVLFAKTSHGLPPLALLVYYFLHIRCTPQATYRGSSYSAGRRHAHCL